MRHRWVFALLLLATGFGAGVWLALEFRDARAEPTCKTGDLDGDGRLGVADALHLLTHIFIEPVPLVPCPSDAPPIVPVSTVFLVRHAEKEGGVDPGLTPAGQARAERLATVFAHVPAAGLHLISSDWTRTVETLAPLAAAKELEILRIPTRNRTIVEAAESTAQAIRELPPGSVTVVAHHSFTNTPILQALGVEDPSGISWTDYDNLIVVQLRGQEAPQLIPLTYP